MAIPFALQAALAAAPSAISAFGGRQKTRQSPLETPQQREARLNLLDFSKTGTYKGFQSGQELPLNYGDYNATGIEKQGLSTLQNLLASGIPSQFQMGNDALRDVLEINPDSIQSQFDPFKTQVKRQIQDANTDFKRQASFAGNLYSSKTLEGLGDIQARGNETLTSELARLTDQALNRRLQAIPLAYQAGEAEQNAAINQVDASQRYGSLIRQLNDANAKAQDAETLRRREELLLPVKAAETVAGSGAQFGIPEISTSPYQQLLQMAGQVGGNYLGNEMFFNQYKRYFPSTASA